MYGPGTELLGMAACGIACGMAGGAACESSGDSTLDSPSMPLASAGSGALRQA